MDLSISRIYGTSSNGPLTIAITKNLVAYVASGGVVVSDITIDKDDNTTTLKNQRFFCATQNKQSASSSPIRSYAAPVIESASKDSYGLPRLSAPVLIKDNSNSSDLLTSSSSPPKPNQLQSHNFNQTQPSRLKAISSIAISPDEKLLALGETGNQPRIHIFSLAPDSNKTPIISILEHSFGIQALKFSPNSENLLSLGLPHDGFIYVWKINGTQVECSEVNKCTSVINGVEWINDEDIITFGVRHVKFWRFNDAGEKRKEALQGKNVVLNDFINCNFVYLDIVRFEEDRILLFFLTSVGDVCWYDVEENTLKQKYKFQEGKKIGAILVDYQHGKLWYGDDDDSATIRNISLEEIDKYDLEPTKFDGDIDSPTKIKFNPKVTMLQKIDEKGVFYITSNEEIKYFDVNTGESKELIDSLSKSNTGLKIGSNGEMINWTKTGQIQRINTDTFDLELITNVKLVEIPDKVIENHITALDITSRDEIVVGDAYGNLSIYSMTGDLIYTTAAHEYSVNDVLSFQIDEVQFIVSIGRDRMIQVFGRSILPGGGTIEDVSLEWGILETLDYHKGNLLKLIHADGSKIYTSSADRSISVHEFKIVENKIIIDKIKTIALKSTPSTIHVHGSELYVSTMDKQIAIYNTRNFDHVMSFKLLDTEMESLLVDNISITTQGYLLCSCSDKTVRVFNHHTMKQLAVNWGHSEPIKSLALLGSDVITLSNNGCLFKWTLSAETAVNNTIQRYNELTPKVTRKIKPVSSSTASTPTTTGRKNGGGLSSPTRTPTISSKLQRSTARLTPSRLANTAKTNLSPSPSSRSNLNNSTLMGTGRRLSSSVTSAAVKVTPNLSPSTKSGSNNNNNNNNPKLSSLNQSPFAAASASPISRGRNVLSVRKIASENEMDENRFKIDEVMYVLKRFKEHMGEYSYDEVNLVKREVEGLFEMESNLIKKYSESLIQQMSSSLQQHNNTV